MRVAHLTPTYFGTGSVVGGGERYVHYLAQSLQSSDVDQVIVTMGTQDQDLDIDGVPVRVLRNQSSLADAMSACSPALRHEIALADLVHIHQSLTVFGAYSLAAARTAGVATVGTDLGGGEDRILLERGGLQLYDGLVSISQFAHDLVAGAYAGRHEILIGPVDTDLFCPDPAVTRDPTTVLVVGRILPHKGIDRIIEALPEGLSLTVVGAVYDHTYAAECRQLAAGKEVTFRHDCGDDELLDLYRRCGVFVQASTSKDRYGRIVDKPELMGLTTLEAMACGAPALVARAGSLPELAPDDRFGRVFATDAELHSRLLEVRNRRWPHEDAAQLARDHVQRNHSMETIGTRLASFYDDVMATRTGR